MFALMTAEPTATPVTSPVLLTVATAALLLCQVTVRPGTTLPSESRTVAVSCCVPCTTTTAGAGATVMEEIDGGSAATTETFATPTAVPLVAVRFTVPTLRAVTRPAPFTTAIVVSVLLHVIERPGSRMPFASDAEAVKVSVSPTSREMFVGEMNTLAASVELVTPLWHEATTMAPTIRKQRAARVAKRTKANSRGNRVGCSHASKPSRVDASCGAAHTGVHSYLRGRGVFR